MKRKDSAIIVYVTVPDEELAGEIARDVITSKLAACVNVLPGIRSVYRWQGEVCTDDELLLLIKTTEELFPELKDRIIHLHKYDLPEVIAVPVTDGSEEYLNWISSSLSSKNNRSIS